MMIYKTYKVSTRLDLFETEQLFDMFNEEVIRNTSSLKMEVLACGKAIGYLEHGYGHAQWLCEMYDKLRPMPKKPLRKSNGFNFNKFRFHGGVWPEMTVTEIDREHRLDKKFPRLFKLSN